MDENRKQHYMQVSRHIKDEVSKFIKELQSAGISPDSLAPCRYENVRLFTRIEALIEGANS